MLISNNYSTRNDIGRWTALNLLASLVAIAAYMATGVGYATILSGFDGNEALRRVASHSAELMAMIPIAGFDLYDFGALIRGDQALSPRLRRFASSFQWETRNEGGPIDPNVAYRQREPTG